MLWFLYCQYLILQLHFLLSFLVYQRLIPSGFPHNKQKIAEGQQKESASAFPVFWEYK